MFIFKLLLLAKETCSDQALSANSPKQFYANMLVDYDVRGQLDYGLIFWTEANIFKLETS